MSNIMLVDDSIFMKHMIQEILNSLGHNVVGQACNGEEAIYQYVISQPDFVFMDITMPKKNGIEALKDIINIDNDARIVMCSAMGQKKMIMESIENGAKDFIVKPFKSADIKNVINKYSKANDVYNKKLLIS